MADLQEMMDLDLEAQTNPRSLAKVRVSTDLPLAQCLPCPKKTKKNQKSAKGRHFMQNQGALYVPIQADVGASWGLWAFLSLWWF